MAEIVEVSEMVTEPEIVTEDVSVVIEEIPTENVIDIEEIAAEVYYYQSEQEVLASSMKSIMPPKVFESFAGYFEELKTGSCPRFEEKKEVVEELIDVSKELTGDALKDIADKALMGKLREVDSELEKSESVSTVSVKKESDQKSGVQEIKSVNKYPDGVGAALNLKLRSIEDDLPESIYVTFSASGIDNESQVIKTVVDQVLDEENKLYSDFEYPLQNVMIENVKKVFKLVEMNINEVNNNEFFSKPKKSFVTSRPISSGKKEGDGKGLPKSILSKWIMDSGASRHMTGTLALLYDVKSINGSYVGFAGNQGRRIIGQGTLTNGVISFDKVNYIVELENNLPSISQICDKAFSVHFTKTECVVLKPGFKIPDEMVLLRAPRENDLYILDMRIATPTTHQKQCFLSKSKATNKESIMWHRKMGHIHVRKMNFFVHNDLVDGVI
ncbi:uncharacterized protein LOC110928394 [Helianthus annuus]|uniref:uncharacterized protein LOC110928394 n=1 Tax=Helianthus annuus TaxID=4232 RepID=UPI000B8F4C82|nr:uncharacterized protein LOC110928394 [Helianthus annuus]